CHSSWRVRCRCPRRQTSTSHPGWTIPLLEFCLWPLEHQRARQRSGWKRSLRAGWSEKSVRCRPTSLHLLGRSPC
ncbi:unnamed protein product, partial [Polarella glacialis]